MITRFDGYHDLEPTNDGDLVFWYDVEPIIAERDRLKTENVRLQERCCVLAKDLNDARDLLALWAARFLQDTKGQNQ